MRIYHIKYLLFSIFLLNLAACDDYLDINTDPNRVTEATLEVLLPTTIKGTSDVHYSVARTVCQVTQHIGSYFDYPEILSLDGPWSSIYLRNLSNLDQMIIQGNELKAPHYVGIAQVLQAINVGLLTDLWEAAPYSQAFQGSDNFIPTYDNQVDLYTTINSLLDNAIANLEETESVFTPGDNDLIYGGDTEKWKKVAYTLKARFAIHLSNKGGNAASDALAALENGLAQNDDDLQLVYVEESRNPWHTNVALSNNTGNFTVTQGSFLIDLMNNNNDPRLNVIADTSGLDGTPVVGITPFDVDAVGPNTNFTEGTWHSTDLAPILILTYSEAKFIEAEAAFINNDNTRAYDAYLAGIEANMTKLDVSSADYLADSNIAVGAENLTLGHIMREKYVALYLHPEAWVDMRRYNYDTSIYTNFEVPIIGNLTEAFQRVRYPDDEFTRNEANVLAVSKDLGVKMWRDQ